MAKDHVEIGATVQGTQEYWPGQSRKKRPVISRRGALVASGFVCGVVALAGFINLLRTTLPDWAGLAIFGALVWVFVARTITEYP